MIRRQEHTKAALAKQLGISRASLYYTSKQRPKDWALKNEIEGLLREHPGYGSPRVAAALGVNEKRAARVMRLFGIRAYRRRGRRFRKSGVAKREYPNLLREARPEHPNEAWVADFTYLPFKEAFVYVATVMDYLTREVVGVSVALRHDASLVLGALFAAVHHLGQWEGIRIEGVHRSARRARYRYFPQQEGLSLGERTAGILLFAVQGRSRRSPSVQELGRTGLRDPSDRMELQPHPHPFRAQNAAAYVHNQVSKTLGESVLTLGGLTVEQKARVQQVFDKIDVLLNRWKEQIAAVSKPA